MRQRFLTSAKSFWTYWKRKNHRPTKAYLSFVLLSSCIAYGLTSEVGEIIALVSLYISLAAYYRTMPEQPGTSMASVRLKRIGEHHFECKFGSIKKEGGGWYAYPTGQPEIGPFQTSTGAVGALLSIADNNHV